MLSSNKESVCQCRSCGFNPWVGKILGEENGNLLQYSYWESPWTEETGMLQSVGLPRVRHNLVTKQQINLTFNYLSYCVLFFTVIFFQLYSLHYAACALRYLDCGHHNLPSLYIFAFLICLRESD